MNTDAGKIFVYTGPSGSGKGTVMEELKRIWQELYAFPGPAVVVSHTTRTPRKGEIDKEHYYFVSKKEFQRMIKEGEFLEWAQYSGHFYGTSKQAVEVVQQCGNIAILEIEVQGAQAIAEHYPDIPRIFLDVGLETLRKRLEGRGSEDEAVCEQRLKAAEWELSQVEGFHHIVSNEGRGPEETALALLSIIES